MDLKAKVKKSSDTKVEISCEVDAKTVSDELARQYKALANKYRFPGFRAGKAPRPVIDNAVGKETVYLDATEAIINAAYNKVIEQENLRPVGEPNFEGGENQALVTDKEPYKMEFSIEVAPEIKLSSYDPVEAYLPPTEATEEDIASQLDMYKGYAGLTPEEELTEEIVKERMGFESMDKLKEAMKELIKNEKEGALPRLKEDVVALKLRERVDFEPSEDMVEVINTGLLNDMYQNLQQYGMTFDQYLASRKLSADEFYDDVKKQAHDEAQTRVALDAWVRHFKLEATDAEIDEEFKKAGIDDVERTKKDWAESGRLWRLREAIERSKAVENAVETAKFTFDEEKSKHQFDYLNEEAEEKKPAKKTAAKKTTSTAKKATAAKTTAAKKTTSTAKKTTTKKASSAKDPSTGSGADSAKKTTTAKKTTSTAKKTTAKKEEK